MRRQRYAIEWSAIRLGMLLTVSLLGTSPLFAAWGPSAFYPTSVDQEMPNPQRAQQLLGARPGVLNSLRDAHRQSLSLGWSGVPQRRQGDPSPMREPAGRAPGAQP